MKIFKLLVTFSFVALSIACSRSSSPLVPDPEKLSSASEINSHLSMGFSFLEIDTISNQIGVIPSRNVDTHLNVTGVLNGTMGVSAVGVPSETIPSEGIFAFDITLTHPFSNPKFSGFDTKGILITPGTLELSTLIFADLDETRLLNADGYSRWWNPVEFTQPGFFGYTQGKLATSPKGLLTATINPYKYFSDALTATSSMSPVQNEPLTNSKGRGIFSAGKSNTRRYVIKFPMNPGPKITYGYAIDASWGMPSVDPPVNVPSDFPPEANQPEAYNIAIGVLASSLYYDTEASVGGGLIKLKINVHDWQGRINGNFAPEISAVRIFIPGLISGGIDATFLEETPTRASYVALIEPINITATGEYQIIVRVGSSNGVYNQNSNPAPAQSISAFNVLKISIPEVDCAADTNNNNAQAQEIGLSGVTASQVCLPSDPADYYKFDVPQGFHMDGKVFVYAAAQTTLSLFDKNESLISVSNIVDGYAEIPMNKFSFLPGTHYIKVETSNNTQVVPYLLETAITTLNVTPNQFTDIPSGIPYIDIENLWKYGNTLIAGGIRGLWIFDISNPSQPVMLYNHEGISVRKLSAFHYPYIYSYRVDPDLGYVLDLIDLTDYANPQVTPAAASFFFEAKGIDIDDSTVYVTLDRPVINDFVLGFDYGSNPQSPPEVLAFALFDQHNLCEVFEWDSKKYFMTWYLDSIILYDITNFNNPVVLDFEVYAQGVVNAITVKDNFVYAHHVNGGVNTLYILQVNMGLISMGDEPVIGAVNDWVVDGDYLYCTSDDENFQIINVSSPMNPQVVTTENLDGPGAIILPHGNYLFHSIKFHAFSVYNITNKNAPNLIFEQEHVNYPAGIEFKGDQMIVLDNSPYGIRTASLYDISNLSDPVLQDTQWTDKSITNLKQHNGYFFFIHNNNQVAYFTISGASIGPLSLINFVASVNDFAFIDDTLFVVTDDSSIHSFDISSLPANNLLGSKPTPDEIRRIAGKGDYLYGIRDLGVAVQVWDINPPNNPSLVKTYVPIAMPWEMFIQDDFIYLAADSAFEIISIETPDDPAFEGVVNIPDSGSVKMLANDGLFAYAGAPYFPFHAISLWPSAGPSIVTSSGELPYHYIMCVAHRDGNLYLGTQYGVKILDLY